MERPSSLASVETDIFEVGGKGRRVDGLSGRQLVVSEAEWGIK